MVTYDVLGPAPGESRRQRGQAAVWPRCLDGYRWDGEGDGEDAVLRPNSGRPGLVFLPRQRSALLHQFVRLGVGTQSRAEFGKRVLDFANEYGSLDSTHGLETLRTWRCCWETCHSLLALIEDVKWLEHDAGTAARRKAIDSALGWDPEGRLTLFQEPVWDVPHPEEAPGSIDALDKIRNAGLGSLSDSQLARLARGAVAAYLQKRLGDRISVSLVGCDPVNVYHTPKAGQLGIRYVATGLLTGIYHVLALELLGRRSVEKRCEECGEVLENVVRRDARFHKRCVRRRYRRNRAATAVDGGAQR